MRPQCGGVAMFVEQIREAVAKAPRGELPRMSAALWKSHAAGAIGDAEAQDLAELIHARKAIPTIPIARRHVGSRPRSPESVERRRRWTSSGWLPPHIAAQFTMAECAVLAVVAEQIARHGRCALALDHLAALAGVSRSTAKNALREAAGLRLVSIKLRPIRPFRHDTNVITIVSREWTSWISMRSRSRSHAPRSNSQPPRNTGNYPLP